METKKKNSFIETALAERKKMDFGERKLKLEKAIASLVSKGLEKEAENIETVCADLEFSNRVIQKALADHFEIVLSESAVRRYRVKHGYVQG